MSTSSTDAENMRHWPKAGSLLAHRLRCRPTIDPPLVCSKHDTLIIIPCWLNVGTTSQTMAQHWANNDSRKNIVFAGPVSVHTTRAITANTRRLNNVWPKSKTVGQQYGSIGTASRVSWTCEQRKRTYLSALWTLNNYILCYFIYLQLAGIANAIFRFNEWKTIQ